MVRLGDKESEAFRERKGVETQKIIDKDIEDTLFFGFKDMKDALNVVPEVIRTNPKMLTISMRVIGFNLQFLYKKIHNTTRNQPACSIYEAYRVSLLQAENKLLSAQREQSKPYRVRMATYGLKTEAELHRWQTKMSI